MIVKKTPYKENFNYTILYNISKGLNQTQIAQKFKLSKPLLSYYFKQLRQNGNIEKIGKGVWIVKSLPSKVGKPHLDKSLTIRGHGFVFKIKIPKLKNWEKRQDFLINNNIDYKLVGIKHSNHSIKINKFKVWLCNESIIVYFPSGMSFFNNSATQSKQEAFNVLFEVIAKLETMFNVSFKINKQYLFSCSRQHYALIKNALAKVYGSKKLEVYDNGELWFLIDNSFNLHETETVSPLKADNDMDKAIKPFFNMLRENPNVLLELTQNTLLNTQVIKAVQNEVVELTKLVIKLKNGHRE